MAADLLAALKPRRSSDDQHIGDCRKRAYAGMCHQYTLTCSRRGLTFPPFLQAIAPQGKHPDNTSARNGVYP